MRLRATQRTASPLMRQPCCARTRNHFCEPTRPAPSRPATWLMPACCGHIYVFLSGNGSWQLLAVFFQAQLLIHLDQHPLLAAQFDFLLAQHGLFFLMRLLVCA